MTDNILEQVDPKALGWKLQEAREARGLTQQAVAEEMEMARTTLVAIEKGERRLSPHELIRLASLYGRSVSELLNRTVATESFVPQFRQAWRDDFAVDGDLAGVADELQGLAEDYLELEQLCGFTQSRSATPQYSLERSAPEQAAEEIAATERNRLGVGDGPMANLRERLETDVGLRIFYFPMPGKISGLFAYNDILGGCVGINSNHPRDRRNWSLAHEYGHFLTNRYQAEVTFLPEKRRQSVLERFADAFAENFLMPASGLNRRFSELHRSSPNGITLAQICMLAHLYQVSVQALVIRLEKLRRFPSGTWQGLTAEGFKPRQAEKLLGLETAALLRRELPRRYETLAVMAYEKGELSEGQLAKYIRADRVTARLLVEELSSGYRELENGFVSFPVDLNLALRGR